MEVRGQAHPVHRAVRVGRRIVSSAQFAAAVAAFFFALSAIIVRGVPFACKPASYQFSQLVGKRLALLHEAVPRAARIAALVNPAHPSDAVPALRNATKAARALGLDLQVFNAGTIGEIDAAFAALVLWRAGAVLVVPDVFFARRNAQIVTLAARHVLPTSTFVRRLVEAGGLMSYGPDNSDNYRQAGRYVGRILKGEKPADMPVQQPTKYEFVINLKTARAIGLSISPTTLARADDIIE